MLAGLETREICANCKEAAIAVSRQLLIRRRGKSESESNPA